MALAVTKAPVDFWPHFLQLLGYNPQACDGQGCPLPKPGGLPGPDGHRIINLLDPAGKHFHKALLDFVHDEPASHQYGYAVSRSRRDAVLHVESWLDRLRCNKKALPPLCLIKPKRLTP